MTPKEEVAEFNLSEVGVEVRYWPGTKQGRGKRSKTKRRAQVIEGRAVVWVEGHSGCVPLSRVQKIA